MYNDQQKQTAITQAYYVSVLNYFIDVGSCFSV